MTWEEYYSSFVFRCRLKNLSPVTIEIYDERLGYFKRYLDGKRIDINDVTKLVITNYVLYLIEHLKPETCNGRIRAIKTFFKYLIDEELWSDSNPCKNLTLLKQEKLIKPIVSPDDISLIIRSTPKNTFEGLRDRTMILLLWDSMIRKSELTSLELKDIDLSRGLIKVYGKGRKERFVPIGINSIKAIRIYLNKYRNDISSHHLFCIRDGKQIEKNRALQIVHNRAEKVGIRLYPHLIRHSAATWFIRSGDRKSVV